uniref:ATP-grasp domain-containing protein n=1 Tax=Ignisphaera aggregans TaxID=334771 RepID=A0A7J3QF81_9CREN
MALNTMYSYSNFKILVIEYVTATFGCNNHYSDLLSEGFSMAYTLAKLLKNYATSHILISHFLSYIHRDIADIAYYINCRDFVDNIADIASRYDKVIVIAPPMELIELAKILKNIWGPGIEYIKSFSDKFYSIYALEKCGIEVPKTIEIRDVRDVDFGLLEYPIVIKPCMQAGSTCVYIARGYREAIENSVKVLDCDPLHRAVIQQYVRGVHGSISAIFKNKKIVFYSINRQIITLENNMFRYKGNVLPIRDAKIIKNVYKLLTQFIECYPDLEGYIGFDIVIENKEPIVVEVNPRITTPFIAIAKLYPEIGKIFIDAIKGIDIDTQMYLGDVTSGSALIAIQEKEIENDSLVFGDAFFSYKGKEIKIALFKR